jgi:nicotinamide riboside transporter PnuC
VNDATVKKIIVTLIALMLFVIWNRSEQVKECMNDCTTDISAQRR